MSQLKRQNVEWEQQTDDFPLFWFPCIDQVPEPGWCCSTNKNSWIVCQNDPTMVCGLSLMFPMWRTNQFVVVILNRIHASVCFSHFLVTKIHSPDKHTTEGKHQHKVHYLASISSSGSVIFHWRVLSPFCPCKSWLKLSKNNGKMQQKASKFSCALNCPVDTNVKNVPALQEVKFRLCQDQRTILVTPGVSLRNQAVKTGAFMCKCLKWE